MTVLSVRRVRARLARALAAVALAIVLVVVAACRSVPHRIEFGDLAKADRIELTTDKISTVTEKSQIEAAAAFFERYHDGWTNVFGGGSAPLYIRFYKNGEDIGTFGVGAGFLSVGPMARYPPEAEIAALVRGLGLAWPPQYP